MMVMRGVVTTGVVAMTLAVSGCAGLTTTSQRTLFDEQYYPARLSHDRADRAAFTVTVNRAEQSLDNAREAGRFEATKYCIEQYGNSDTTWTVGPDSEAVAIRDGQITLAGRCTG